MTPSAAIVLAAGEGRRMGGPKGLLIVDGRPLIEAHVQRLREVGCGPVVVVARGVSAELVERLPHVLVLCAQTGSMAASLAFGVRELPERADGLVVVAPVDGLPARISTLHALLHAAASEGVLVATPQHRGRGGHPIVLRQQLLRRFGEGDAGTLRELVRGVGARRRRVEVDDPGVLIDLDTPDDLAVLRPGVVPSFLA